MQLRCTRSSSFPYEGIYASCCHWRSQADVLALTTRSPTAWSRNGQIECVPRHQPILLSSPSRCPRALSRYYVILLFDVVLNWSLGLLALALQNEEFPHSNRLFVAIADERFRTPPTTFLRIFRSSRTHFERFWLY
jgi:hypothetical protein